MITLIPQSVVVDQLQIEVDRFMNRTTSPSIDAARTQCASRVELDHENHIKVLVEMEYAVDENILAEMAKFRAEPVDMKHVEEGV